MDVFEKQYSAYRRVLCLIGLWPYHTSIYSTLHRTGVTAITIVCVTIQIVSMIVGDVTLQNCFLTLSTVSPLTIFLSRYISSIYIFPVMKFFFERIQGEESGLQTSEEMTIFTKCIDDSSRVIALYLCMACVAIVIFTGIMLSPIVLDLVIPLNGTRERYIYYMTVLFTDRIVYIDLITVNTAIVAIIALLALACTEAVVVVVAYYICGLFKIASSRLRNAIIDAANVELFTSSKRIAMSYHNIYLAVDIQNRAIEYTDTLIAALTIPYLIASILIVISFAINLHRLFHAIKSMDDAKEIAVCVMLVIIHLIFMFLNNYLGQMVIDNSLDVFGTTYNSMWYSIPIRIQKMILFVMMRSSIQCAFNLSGLFTPCYAGFSTMMSSSFSYFTMMYSFQQT